PGFDLFWRLYPRKMGKGEAIRSWKRLGCEENAEVICDSVRVHIRCEQWKKSEGQFIPLPATFLNQEGWMDDPDWTLRDSRREAFRKPTDKVVQTPEGTMHYRVHDETPPPARMTLEQIGDAIKNSKQ